MLLHTKRLNSTRYSSPNNSLVMNTKHILTIFTLIATSLSGAVAQNITFTEKELYPEGIDYNAKDKSFYVTSLHYGKVGKVSADGTYATFIDDADIPSAIGIRIDKVNNQLIVCGSDPGVSVKTNVATQRKLAKLGFYDLTTGKRKALVDLEALNTKSELNFANDIAIDKNGNVFVTNSFAPIVYKIDAKTYKASIFAQSELFAAEGFGLNGLVALDNGNVVVCNSRLGALYVIDGKTPTKIAPVIVEADLKGADGLFLNGNTELVVISNAQQKVFRLNSTDGFATARVTGEAKSINTFPTTGVVVNNKYYVLNAKLNEIFTPGAVLTSDYIIQEVTF